MKDPQPTEESSSKQCQNYTNYENGRLMALAIDSSFI